MKIRSIYVLATFLFLSFTTNNSWREFRSLKGNFKILTVGDMKEQVQYRETELGMITVHNFIHTPKDKEADNLLYLVTYYDFPEGSIHSDSTELLDDFYEATVESSHKLINGKLLYSSEISLGDYKGINWRVDYGNGVGTIRERVFVVKNRYYAIRTYTLKEKGLNPAIDRFMDSFNLLANK